MRVAGALSLARSGRFQSVNLFRYRRSLGKPAVGLAEPVARVALIALHQVHDPVRPAGQRRLLVALDDLATPFNGIEQTVSHMMLEPHVRKNVSFTYYEAGHMMYVDKKCREKLHKDITEWIIRR